MDYFFNRDASIRAILMILGRRKRVTRKVLKYRFGRVGRTPPMFRSALYSLLLPPFGTGSVTLFDLALL